MPNQLKVESGSVNGIHTTSVKTSKRLTAHFLEHLRGRYIHSFEITLNAESSDDGVFDLFILEGSDGAEAFQSYRISEDLL